MWAKFSLPRFILAGIIFFSEIVHYQEKQDYFNAISLEQHLVLPTTSSQSYDGFGDSSSQLACESNNCGSVWYPKNATKQQRDPLRQQRYQCPKCGNKYKYLGDMKKHLRFQCGKEPKFQCPYCRKRTKVSSNMYAHVRSMHGDLPIYIIDLNRQSVTL